MFSVVGWIFYGLIIGVLARSFHPGKDELGIIPTILLGIAGSYVGGMLGWVLGFEMPFIMAVAGGTVLCFVYSWYIKNKNNVGK